MDHPSQESGNRALRILGIGLDIVAVSRIRSAARRSGERFLKKVFAPAEVRYCSGRAREYEHLAARFAAKEATLKALGSGITGWAALQEVEVVRKPSGRPRLLLRGEALRRALSLGVTVAHLSLSHTEQLAAAEVVLEGRVRRPASSAFALSTGLGASAGSCATRPPDKGRASLPDKSAGKLHRVSGKPAGRLRQAGRKAGWG